MNPFAHITRIIAPELEELNRCMVTALSTSNKMMDDIVTRYMATKGKQIRPVLVLLSAKMLGGVTKDAISNAAAIEMLHNASLIHDDVVDDTMMRRGKSTINAVWDNHVAVLVGDFFVSTSLQQAILSGDMRAISEIGALGRKLALGEIDQIDKARNHALDEDAYIEIIANKTASLFVACVRMGGYSAGASDKDIESLGRFAYKLGLCFQIRDDIFDYFDDSDKVGKPSGNDLREGKVTLPLLYALSRKELPQCDEMNRLVRLDSLDSADIDRLIKYAKEGGGIDYAYEYMERLRGQAIADIMEFPESEVRDAFVQLFDFIIARNF